MITWSVEWNFLLSAQRAKPWIMKTGCRSHSGKRCFNEGETTWCVRSGKCMKNSCIQDTTWGPQCASACMSSSKQTCKKDGTQLSFLHFPRPYASDRSVSPNFWSCFVSWLEQISEMEQREQTVLSPFLLFSAMWWGIVHGCSLYRLGPWLLRGGPIKGNPGSSSHTTRVNSLASRNSIFCSWRKEEELWRHALNLSN